ncbi:MAG: BlaI/MecI/CopY family transcriptional regulator [Balneolaceae bacterium]|nr:MAG: BlaI/MecI/CopY family transcriptional regulator [Balneolaceae bacterium]
MRKPLNQIGETEMEILNIIWELGEGSVSDVRDRMLEYRDVAYTTVMTILKNLADKGYLRYEERGRSYIYSPALKPEEVRSGLLGNLLEKVFKGSPKELVQALVQNENLSDADRTEIRKMIEEMGDE